MLAGTTIAIMLRARGPVGVCTVVLVATAALLFPSVSAAFPPNGGSETSTGTAPADGALVTATDTVPANATHGSFEVQPMPGTDAQAFDEVTGVLVDDFPPLAKLSKRSRATLACVFMSYLPLTFERPDHVYTFTDVEAQAAFLNICLQMAQTIPSNTTAPDAARAAASPCPHQNPAIAVTVTHSRSGYTATTGALRRVRRPGLVVSCRRKGKGLLITVKPHKRGQKLRAAAGPKLAIAYSNRGTKPVGIRTVFTAH